MVRTRPAVPAGLRNAEGTAPGTGSVRSMVPATEGLSGRLRVTGVAELFRGLASHRFTGVVRVGNPASTWLVMCQGHLVCAGTTHGEQFAAGLRASGVVHPEWLEATIRSVGSLDLPLLDSVARSVDAAVLQPVVRERVIGVVFDLFLGPDDVYSAIADAPHELSTRFAVSVEDVLAEVSNRFEQWTRIATSIPSTDVVFRAAPRLAGGQDRVSIDAVSWEVLAAMDGRRSVAQVIGATGLDALVACRAIHELHCQGLVERTR